MKKFYWLMILAICGLAPVSAFAEGKVALGVQGGLTFPDYQFKNTSPSAEYENKNGWLGGLFGEFGVSSVTLRPELNYVTKSYTVTNVAEVKNHFIEIPVLVKFNPFGSFPVSPFILLGPQWSKQTSADVTTIGGTTSYTNTATGWDIAAVAGLGLELNVTGSLGIEVQGRYAYGFRNIDSSTAEVKTRAFYALAGLSFTL